MEMLAKALVGGAALSLLLAVVVGVMGGAIAGFPAESFSRACTNLALISIAVQMMASAGSGTSTGM